METKEKYTVGEVIEITIDIRKEIKFSADEIDSIGNPLRSAINNLHMCVNALAQKPENNPEPEEEELPEAEVTEIGNAGNGECPPVE